MTEPGLAPPVRRIEPADAELVTGIITASFKLDPLWSRAMARADGSTEHHRVFWQLFIEGALRNPWSWLTGGGEAASIWIPPDGTEMSEDQEHLLIAQAAAELGSGSAAYVELLERFAAAHPRTELHYYLSLLGTHPAHRGRGLGMALLAHDLALVDLEHMPAYLESSNPANDHRYAGVGFEPIGQISFPGDGPAVTTMWRKAR